MRKKVLMGGVGILVLALTAFIVARQYRLGREYRPPRAILESFSTSGHGMKLASTKKVILALHINESGVVFEDSIVRSSGDSLVDSVALAQALQYRFEPAKKGSKPIDTWVNLPIKFHSEEAGSTCPALERRKQPK